MPALLLQIHPDNPQIAKIRAAVEIIKKGGLVIYPTDTVYAIGCDIYNQKAVEKVCRLKDIQPGKINLSFICKDLSHISEYTKSLPTNIFKLMKHVLPGPYTFILNASSNVPNILNTKKKTIGIRVPDHKIIQLLIEELGNPILSTSIKNDDAILEYTTDPEEIYDRYKNLVDVIIDGGFGGNEASTILDCTGNEVEVVRVGKGSVEEL
ncbi:L-threonylcarbamoyladenylate synthase [uncultured Cytophaga sp.]|uniref:L-threonylcarbamoyladenylate synthase n=1 Tax=uncultured Cytophaga sp. TaxID=160238 RepID=UPI00260B3E54|nr:L-threonylcarbamoyladenylate synthase [uncultured Cytophaga sp.]